jgi:two-component system, OmpR family, response regulator
VILTRLRASAAQKMWRFGAIQEPSVDTTCTCVTVAVMQKVLVVDDDAHIREVVCFALRRAGYQPLQAGDGLAALQIAERELPALIILDILMPELDGTAVCSRLRATSEMPVIFLTSKDEEMDRILGLELGADDYVVKPFSPRELVARVKAVLRRRGVGAVIDGQKLTRGDLVIDLEAHVASWAGKEVALTATEFALLKAIAAQPRRAFTRENLMIAAYETARFVSDRTIDSHIRHIRAKFQALGGDPIETVHGVGYRLATT